MFDASTEIAGLMIRSENSSSDSASSCDVKVMSTPRTVVTGRSTFSSTVSCEDMLMPERTVYCTGLRTRRVSPIFAPACPNDESY